MEPHPNPQPAGLPAAPPASLLGKLALPKANPQAIQAWAGAIRDLAILFALIPVAWFAFRVAFSQSTVIEDRLIHIVKHGKWELGAFGIKVVDIPIEQRQADLQAISAQFDQLSTSLEKGAAPAKLKVEASVLAQTLERLKAEGDNSIKAAVQLLAQKEQNTSASAQAKDKRLTGWVFLGRVDDSPQRNWQPQAATVEPIAFAGITKGAELVVKDSVFVRGDDGDADRSRRDVIGVARKGDRLRVLDKPYPSRSKLGGDFIWVMVEHLPA